MFLRKPPLIIFLSISSHLLFFISVVHAETQCTDIAEIAFKPAKIQGQSPVCCNITSLSCYDPSGVGCSNDLWVNCMQAGDSQACIVPPSAQWSAPCAGYTGERGQAFGISPVGAENVVHLLNDNVQEMAQKNWPELSSTTAAVLCCPLASDPSGSHLFITKDYDKPSCNVGEYELLCLGTDTLGVCTAYTSDEGVHTIGQQYLVNFEHNVTRPHSSSSSPGGGPIESGSSDSHAQTPTVQTTGTINTLTGDASLSGTGSPPSSGPSPFTASSTSVLPTKTASAGRSRTNAVAIAIAVPIAAIFLALLALVVYFYMRRVRASRRRNSSVSPYVLHHAGPGLQSGVDISASSAFVWQKLRALRSPLAAAPDALHSRHLSAEKLPPYTD